MKKKSQSIAFEAHLPRMQTTLNCSNLKIRSLAVIPASVSRLGHKWVFIRQLGEFLANHLNAKD